MRFIIVCVRMVSRVCFQILLYCNVAVFVCACCLYYLVLYSLAFALYCVVLECAGFALVWCVALRSCCIVLCCSALSLVVVLS